MYNNMHVFVRGNTRSCMHSHFAEVRFKFIILNCDEITERGVYVFHVTFELHLTPVVAVLARGRVYAM